MSQEERSSRVLEKSLSRDDDGIVKTESGKWHVFRNGKPFSCSKGDKSRFSDGGPYVEVEKVKDVSPFSGEEIREKLQEKKEQGDSLCQHCATCYDVEYP